MSFSLADTMSAMAKNTAALEKEPAPSAMEATQRRAGGAGEEVFTYLARALDKARTVILDLPPAARANVELEARLGIFCHGNRGEDERVFPHCPGAGAIDLGDGGPNGPQTRFFSGVTRGAFEQMKATVAGLGGGSVTSRHLHEVVYLYPDKRRLRCEDGATTGVLEQKRRLMNINVALPAAPYDLRITLSVETAEGAGQPVAVADGWEARREKLRTSFRDPQGNATLGPWQLDFTCVTSAEQDRGRGFGGGEGEEEETTEVEMELHGEAVAAWLGAEAAAADAETSRLASRLLDTVKRLNPLERAVADARFLQPVPPGGAGGAVHDAIRQRVQAIYQACGGGGGGGRNLRFPGTMPVNLCRKDVAAVQQGGYWLAEKTDGVRYLLFVVGAAGAGAPQQQQQTSCFLVDRAMAVSTFLGADGLGQALPVNTVLDGELVYNRLTSSYVFLVFDCLFWGNDALVQAPFNTRLRAIHQRVLPLYEQAVAKALLAPGRHLPLVGKKFYRRTNIAQLFARVSEEEGHRVYRDAGCISAYLHYLGLTKGGKDGEAAAAGPPKRVQSERDCLARYYHKTDGIVFQPDAPYQTGTDTGFFKWKWMDTVTIDFAINPQPYKVTCGGPGGGGLDLTKQVRLEPLDLMRLRADIAHSGGGGRRIAECGFSVETGLWTYKMLRPDKTDPNYFTTVCTTMLELAEGVEEEELQYRVTVAHPAQDDWHHQVNRMRRTALGWRLKQLQQAEQEQRGGGGAAAAASVMEGVANGE